MVFIWLSVKKAHAHWISFYMLCYIISDWEPRDSTLNLTLTIPHINESYLTTARTAAFIPCASPPEVNTAIVFPIPNCWLIELIEVSAIPKVFMAFIISPDYSKYIHIYRHRIWSRVQNYWLELYLWGHRTASNPRMSKPFLVDLSAVELLWSLDILYKSIFESFSTFSVKNIISILTWIDIRVISHSKREIIIILYNRMGCRRVPKRPLTAFKLRFNRQLSIL